MNLSCLTSTKILWQARHEEKKERPSDGSKTQKKGRDLEIFSNVEHVFDNTAFKFLYELSGI